MVETRRSKQIAMLRRRDDDGGVPTVQVKIAIRIILIIE